MLFLVGISYEIRQRMQNDSLIILNPGPVQGMLLALTLIQSLVMADQCLMQQVDVLRFSGMRSQALEGSSLIIPGQCPIDGILLAPLFKQSGIVAVDSPLEGFRTSSPTEKIRQAIQSTSFVVLDRRPLFGGHLVFTKREGLVIVCDDFP